MPNAHSVACLSALLLSSAAIGQNFELVVTVTPPGSSANPASWQPVIRFAFADSGAASSALPNIPAGTGEIFDPASAAFRTATDLFVGNRHGNVLGTGSISRFTVTGSGVTFVGNYTTPGMIGVHEIAFSPTTGELFAAAVNNGIFRFTVDGSNPPVPAGQFAAGTAMRGVCVHPNGRYVYATSASSIIRVYRIEDDNSVTTLPPLAPAGASNLHFFCLGPSGDELYVSDINANRVFRFLMLPDGTLVPKPSIPSSAAIDCAFSADGLEMFVGNHFQGGITRYAYDAVNDGWVQSGSISTPSMGGFASYVRPPCGNTDLGRQGGERGADGVLDNNDFVVFIDLFFENDPRVDFGTTGGAPGSDGVFDNNDFVVYIDQFFFGCF